MRLLIWGNGIGRRWNGRCLRKADAEDSHDDSPAGSGQAKMAVSLFRWKACEADSCGVDFVTDIQSDQHGGY